MFLILTLCFFAGRGAAELVSERMKKDAVAAEGKLLAEAADSSCSWGLGFGEPGTKPRGNVTPEELAQYHAYYIAPGDEKKLYLTFDCGYENGNTGKILDALKKHGVSATFFVVGHFLESAPELVQRMYREGHTIGNHTYHHPDMSRIADSEAFRKEMEDVEAQYRIITGQEMPKYYRPPQGKYNVENLRMADKLGYFTFFWSLAYVDWKTEEQPTHEEAFAKLTGRVHPGAVVLLHNTSATNGEILDELLCRWEEMGYAFGTLEELVDSAAEQEKQAYSRFSIIHKKAPRDPAGRFGEFIYNAAEMTEESDS